MTPMPCDRCGQPHANCTAHRRDGQPCGQRRMVGQMVCKMHGGKQPAARANGAAKVRAAKAAKMAEKKLGFDVIDTAGFDPIAAMVRGVMKLEAMQESLSSIVNGLEEMRYRGGSGEQLRAEVTLYRQLLNDVIMGAERLAKLDLEGRRASLQERYVTELVGLVQRVLEALALSEAQWVMVPGVVRRVLGAAAAEVAGELEAGGGS